MIKVAQINDTITSAITQLRVLEECIRKLDKHDRFVSDMLDYYLKDLEDLQYTLDGMQAKLKKQSGVLRKSEPETSIMNYVVARHMATVAALLNENQLYEFSSLVEMGEDFDNTGYSTMKEVQELELSIEALNKKYDVPLTATNNKDVSVNNLEVPKEHQTAVPSDLPARHGKGWTQSEIDKLIKMYESGSTVKDMASELDRTTGSILFRLSIVFPEGWETTDTVLNEKGYRVLAQD